jgi:excisionase family DNA binding protein
MSGSFLGSFRRKYGRRRIDRQGHESIWSIRRHPPAKDRVMGAGNVAKRGARTKTIWFGSEPYSLPIEPLTVRIPVAVLLTGIGRSKIYELIKAGNLETVKVGASTLITVASLKRLIEKPKQ